MSKSQSMLNNLKSIAGNKYGADEAKAILSSTKQRTKCSEMELLERMVIFSFENSPEYNSARKLVISDKTREKKAKSCLSALRSLTGKTEQALLVSMVKYASEHDKSLLETV